MVDLFVVGRRPKQFSEITFANSNMFKLFNLLKLRLLLLISDTVVPDALNDS